MEENKNNNSITKLWHQSRLEITDNFLTPPEVISVGNSVIGTLGNFSASTGKAKSKKTFNVCSIVAAAMSDNTILHYNANLPVGQKKILYIDTEQSPFHCKIVLERIFKLACLPLDMHPDTLEFLSLRRHSPNVRVNIVEEAIYNTNDLGLVIIDGIRDLAYDINSSSEATELISKLMKWTDERNLHIHTVLHQNKGDNNSRGHIGTELNNKAKTILQIAKEITDPDISIVSAVHIRTREFEKFAFRINDMGLPELIDDYENKEIRSKKGVGFIEILEKSHREALLKAFSEKEELNYGALIISLKSAYESIGYTYGRNKITDLKVFLINKRMILKVGKLYKYNSEFYY